MVPNPVSAQAALVLLPECERRLTASQRAALDRLAGYDLSLVRDRLLAEGVLPAEWVDEAVFEFRRFFGLCVLAGEPVAMYSQAVDEAWHASILFTRLYADLCQVVAGQFIHHDPAALDPADGSGPAGDGFAAFKQAYESTYGPLTPMWRFPRLWWTPRQASFARSLEEAVPS